MQTSIKKCRYHVLNYKHCAYKVYIRPQVCNRTIIKIIVIFFTFPISSPMIIYIILRLNFPISTPMIIYNIKV